MIGELFVVAIGKIGAHRCGSTSCWARVLTLSSYGIDKCIGSARADSSESACASVVVLTSSAVCNIVSISSGCAERILAVVGQLGLAWTLVVHVVIGGGRVEVLSLWARQYISDSADTTEISGTEVVAEVKAICSAYTEWVLAAIWNLILALSSLKVEVSGGASSQGVYSTGTVVVRGTEVVGKIVSICFSLAKRVAAASRYASLTRSSLNIEVQSSLTLGNSLETIRAGIVSDTGDVNDKVSGFKPVGIPTVRMLAAVGYTSLANSSERVVVSIVGACVDRLEAIRTSVVRTAQSIDWVVAVGSGLTETVLTS